LCEGCILLNAGESFSCEVDGVIALAVSLHLE
jgi:hypothetical protein